MCQLLVCFIHFLKLRILYFVFLLPQHLTPEQGARASLSTCFFPASCSKCGPSTRRSRIPGKSVLPFGWCILPFLHGRVWFSIFSSSCCLPIIFIRNCSWNFRFGFFLIPKIESLALVENWVGILTLDWNRGRC